MKNQGDSLKIALEKSGVDTSGVALPDWVMIEDVPGICKGLGLTWHGAGNIEIMDGDGIILVYRTTQEKGTFLYTEKISEHLTKRIHGVILSGG